MTLTGPNVNTTFSERFIAETVSVLNEIDPDQIEAVARGLAMVREGGGRLFVLEAGGSAGDASPVVDDFRKICNFETYSFTDNISELTARDGMLVFSLGGGDLDTGVSFNLIRAIDQCRKIGASVFGIVGRDGGYTNQTSDACVVVPPVFVERITAHTEGLFAMIWHLLVSHPILQARGTHWEQVAAMKAVADGDRLARLTS